MSAIDTPRPASDPSSGPYRRGDWIEGRYQLLRLLGEGGMGSVWAAHNHMLDIQVALKVIRADAYSEGADARLLREARTAARLNHPAITRVHELGETERGDPYIVMELLSGETLSSLIDRDRRIGSIRAVQLLLPIAEALTVAHAAGVVHRDVKPDNIVLTEEHNGRLQPKLIDFGVAKLVRGAALAKLTRRGAIVGSPEYASPEQIIGGDDVDERSDIWGFCVVLYEAITGRILFSRETSAATFRAVLESTPPPTTDFSSGDQDLWEIISRGLEKDPSDRWSSMSELGDALKQWLVKNGASVDATGSSLHDSDPPPADDSTSNEESTGGNERRSTPKVPSSPVARKTDQRTLRSASDNFAGRYRLEEVIGSGSVSTVYRAIQLDLNRPVAVKTLEFTADDTDELGRRLRREAELGAKLRHAGVTQIYEAGVTDDGVHFIAMELLEGETLADRIERDGHFEPREAVELASLFASALGALHQLGYVHRDVKPTNLFLLAGDAGRMVKLLDFGAVRRIGLEPGADADGVSGLRQTARPLTVQTTPGYVFGTPQYMSPEQILGEALDERSDVYALAAVVYEMLTGSKVFFAGNATGVLELHLTAEPEPLASRAPNLAIPAAVDRVVMRALSKRADVRPPTAARFAEELWQALEPDLDTPIPPLAGLPRAGVARYALGAVAICAMAVLGFIAVEAWSSRNSNALSPPASAAHAVPTANAVRTSTLAPEPTGEALPTAGVDTTTPLDARAVTRPKRTSVARTPAVATAAPRTAESSQPAAHPPTPSPSRARSNDYSLPELKPLEK